METKIKDGLLVRVLLLLFCGWLWVLAGAVIAPIAYYLIAFKDFLTFLGSGTYFQIIYIISPGLIALTVLILLTASVIGFFSSILYNRCLLTTFNIILIISVVTHLAGAAIFLALHDEISSKISDSMRLYMKEPEEDVLRVFNSIQSGLKCCGTYSYRDWALIGQTIPSSCCIQPECDTYDIENIFTTGCAHHLETNFRWISILSMVVAVLVTCMETFGFIISYILICKPRYVIAHPV